VTLGAHGTGAIEAEIVGIGLQARVAAADAATFPVILALLEVGREDEGESDRDLRPGITGRAGIRSKE
jgi:hypothetical protein